MLDSFLFCLVTVQFVYKPQTLRKMMGKLLFFLLVNFLGRVYRSDRLTLRVKQQLQFSLIIIIDEGLKTAYFFSMFDSHITEQTYTISLCSSNHIIFLIQR
jgi:hypothetical protein